MVSPTQLCWRCHSLPLRQRYVTVSDSAAVELKWEVAPKELMVHAICVSALKFGVESAVEYVISSYEHRFWQIWNVLDDTAEDSCSWRFMSMVQSLMIVIGWYVLLLIIILQRERSPNHGIPCILVHSSSTPSPTPCGDWLINHPNFHFHAKLLLYCILSWGWTLTWISLWTASSNPVILSLVISA